MNRVVKHQHKNPREIALEVLHRIEAEETFAEQALLASARDLGLSSLDRRFIGELVHGTTKMRRRLDYVLSLFLERKLEELTPWIRNILRMGLYQIDFLDKVPERAAVDESVKLAKRFGHRGTAALVNAVLRNFLRDRGRITFPSKEENPIENIALFYSFPDWMVEKWLELFGEEQTVRLCEAFNRRPQLSCRVNLLKVHHQGLEETFKREKVKFKPGRFLKDFYTVESKIDLDRFAPLQQGLVYFQDESAGLPVVLLDPQPGERILDLCAAPGGKSSHIAQRMRDQGEVLAVDLSEPRLKMVEENCKRLGVRSVVLCTADARDFRCSEVDRILVDAPCSALGNLGRHSDARWTKKAGDLPRLQELQLEILSNAAKLLKKGGVLVYSTCTITAEENDRVVAKFLEAREDFTVRDSSEFVNPAVVDESGMVRTLPHIHKIDGSFACRLEKR